MRHARELESQTGFEPAFPCLRSKCPSGRRLRRGSRRRCCPVLANFKGSLATSGDRPSWKRASVSIGPSGAQNAARLPRLPAKLVPGASDRTGDLPSTNRLRYHCANRANWGDRRGLNPYLRVHSATCRPLHHELHSGPAGRRARVSRPPRAQRLRHHWLATAPAPARTTTPLPSLRIRYTASWSSVSVPPRPDPVLQTGANAG